MNSAKQGMTRDMTQGNVLSNILTFAIPLFISNFFQQCYNIGDTMSASHGLGQAALAAIGLTGSITGLVIGFANGINSGYGILLSRAFGSKDEEQMKTVVAWTLILNLIISVLVTIVTLVFADPMLRLIQTPQEIFPESRTYLLVVMGGMAATLFYNMGSGLLRAVGNSKTPLYFLVFSCMLNLLQRTSQRASYHRFFHGTDELYFFHRFCHSAGSHQYSGNYYHCSPYCCKAYCYDQ